MRLCNADRKNNQRGEASCVLLRNATVQADGTVVASAAGANAAAARAYGKPGTFPASGKSRFHMTPILLRFTADAIEASATDATGAATPSTEPPARWADTPVGLFQPPVIGAQYHNLWHTFTDYASMLFHTASPLLLPPSALADEDDGTNTAVADRAAKARGNVAEARDRDGGNNGTAASVVTWVTVAPRQQLGKGCATAGECGKLSLFDPFRRLFANHAHFVGAGGRAPTGGGGGDARRYRFLIVGANTRCCPVPTEGVGVPLCTRNLRRMRDYFLRLYGLPAAPRAGRLPGEEVVPVSSSATAPPVASSPSSPPSSAAGVVVCPHVHVMSRQSERYRRMTPWPDILAALRGLYRARGCPEGHIRPVALSGALSFADQVRSVANASVLVAGRGGGTGLAMFLPVGGVYLSVSGPDRWNPWRDLEPPWLTVRHHRAQLVHHENPSLPPQKFKGGGVDANRCGYKVVPAQLAADVGALVDGIAAQRGHGADAAAS